ncbi:hypothetical protein JOE61_001750 [Nocardioides salarius]|uniref:Uncharacterized protein n=1 Tax=Nocardioides salarius TaxID=374513 RepID=A0ABS2M9T3_9ACTN|nr:hypothetical protein [Nocardioides salarius]MBM7507936.1 hypothetical protein [Nocardioides salarius]
MADDDRSADSPSLEAPSLGLGRWRRRKKTADEAAPAAATGSSDDATATVPVVEPEPLPDVEPTPQPEPDPVPAPTPAPAPTPPPASREPVRRPTPPARPAQQPAQQQVPQQAAETRTAQTAGAPLFVDEVAADEPTAARSRSPFSSLFGLRGRSAAAATGAVVGALVVVLTWLSLRLCEVLQGTPSCGNPGIFLLLAIMVAMVVLGGAMLRAAGAPDPTSTAFLAVGLLCVVALLFLVDALMSPWMAIVIPLVAVGAFVLSHWVTTAVVEPARD